MHRLNIALGLVFIASVAVEANTIIYQTPPGSFVTGGPVSASATFTTNNGTLTVLLSDLLANPTADSQLVSDLQFTFGPGVTGTTTLSSSSSTEITISSGVGTLGSTVDTGWGFGAYNSGEILCIICPAGITPPYHTSPPSHLLIGPGPYTNANSSIEQHNPSLYKDASFTITNASITSFTTITSATFSFGTVFGSEIPGQQQVPEPQEFLLAALGLGLIFLSKLRRPAWPRRQ